MTRVLVRAWLPFVVVPLFLGCGPRLPETGPVTGKVTFQGKPVPEGTITFYPTQGRSATARLQPDGSYTLTTFSENDGAIVGSHQVTIEAVRFNAPPRATSFEEEIATARGGKRMDVPAQGPQWLVPQKYSDRTTSDLKAEVQSGKNTIDFNLP